MITKELEDAYRRTSYRVDVDGGIIELKVGERSLRLEEIVSELGENKWVIVTAFNPRSTIISGEENLRRDQELNEQLAKTAYVTFRTAAIDPEGKWPAELGFLVIGMKIPEGEVIARHFDQNAILTGKSGIPVQLHFVTPVCHRNDDGA